MKSSNKGFIVPALVIIVALSAIGGYFVWSSKRSTGCIQVITTAKNIETNEIKDFPTPCDVPDGWEQFEPIPIQAVTTDISDWKIYQNSETFYEFRYPDYGMVNIIDGITSETSVDLVGNYNVEFRVLTTPQTFLCADNPYSDSYLEVTSAKVVEDKIQKDGHEYRRLSMSSMSNSSTEENRYYIVKDNICYMIVEKTLYPDKVDAKIKTDLSKIFSTFKFTK